MMLSLVGALAWGLIVFSMILHASIPSLFGIFVYRLETSKVTRDGAFIEGVYAGQGHSRSGWCPLMYDRMFFTPGWRKKSTNWDIPFCRTLHTLQLGQHNSICYLRFIRTKLTHQVDLLSLATGVPTERISQFVDFFLQPGVKNIRSYIKDTTHFLSVLSSIHTLNEGTILVTLDVSSLYTNIPNREGIEACKIMLNTMRPHARAPTNDSIIKLLTLVLSKNNFDFNEKHYLQIGGTAMGTRVAPSYANTFMGWF